jgi:hypothetical protein
MASNLKGFSEMRFGFSLAAATLALAAPAHATFIDTSGNYEVVRVEFNGVVTASGTDNLQIRDADNNLIPYTGPAPDYPLDTGDTFTLSFDAVIPNAQAIADGFVPLSADGIYRFEIGPPTPQDNFREFAAVTNVSGTGGIGPDPDDASISGRPFGAGLVIVYDAIADSYSLDSTSEDGFAFGINNLDGPLLVYDQVSNLFMTSLFSAAIPASSSSPFLGFNGNSAAQGTFLSGVYQPGTPSGGYLFDVDIDGGWNLPFFGASDPVPVPAPPMLILFGLAAAGVLGRRKLKPVKAA